VFRAGGLHRPPTLEVTHPCSAPDASIDRRTPLDVTRVPRRATRSTTDTRHWTSLVSRAGRLNRHTEAAGGHSCSAPVDLTDDGHPPLDVTRVPRRATRSTTDTRHWTSLVFRAGVLDGQPTLDVTRVPRRWTRRTPDAGCHSCSAPARRTSLVFRTGGLDRRRSLESSMFRAGVLDGQSTLDVTRVPCRWT
jgi:hypothetical protein